MGWKTREQRRHLIYYLPIRDRDTGEMVGRLVDISTGGLRMLSERELVQGSVRHLALVCEDMEDLPAEIPIDAESVWCQPDLNPELLAVGLRFLSANTADREALDRLVADYGFVDSTVEPPCREVTGAYRPSWRI